MIRLVQPQVVMVELCAGRAARLRSPGGAGAGDFLKVGGWAGGWMLRASGAVQTGLA
jgi:hypothetical protein